MTPTAQTIVSVLVLAMAYAAPAAAFVKCRTPEGQLMFVDKPPPGCVVEGEMKNAPPAPEPESTAGDAGGGEGEQAAQDAGDAQAIAARRRIERDLENVAEELVRVRQRMANAPRLLPGIYVNTEDGSGSFQQTERRDDAELRAQEKSLLSRIQALKDEFAKLTREIEQRHGGSAPSWWNPTARCRQCP